MTDTGWYDALYNGTGNDNPFGQEILSERRANRALLSAHLAVGGSPLNFPSRVNPERGNRVRAAFAEIAESWKRNDEAVKATANDNREAAE